MLTTYSVANFRCFRALSLNELGRINLIAGKNNVGKSALLESMHLHCLPEKPHLWIKVHKLRGIDDPLESIEECARWLFRDGISDVAIETASCDVSRRSRSTACHMVSAESSRREFPNVEQEIAKSLPALAGSDVGRLILVYSIDGITKYSVGSVGHLRHGGYQSLSMSAPDKIPNLFLGSLNWNEERDIRHFGDLERAKRLSEIIPPLQHIDRRIQRLSLVPFAGKPRIHGDLDGFAQLVPLSQIGEGVRRLLSILLSISVVPGGIVFIDEIENGLHYSVQTQIWAAIAEAARQHDVQVFATTHSWECLRYAHEAFSDDEVDDFRLHRLDRVDGEITVTTYDRDTIEAALSMGVEVR